QHKSLILIREAEAKITEYEHLMANTSDKDLRYQIYEKLKEAHAMITNHKKAFHSKKRGKQIADQTVVHSLDSIRFVEHVPTCSPYFLADEVTLSLDCINTQQIQLSKAAFVEDFSNLPSTNSLYLLEVFDLRDTLSDTE
ncbi:15242_t:CDS:2, partial [Gigaspora rosea]